MKKLDNRDLFNLDQELLNFRRIDQAIWTRKAELMAKNGDDLVGGGKYGISKPTENTVMKFATDVTLKNLELFKETVETLKKKLTGEQLDIFYLRWGQARLDWEEIAEKKFFSSSTIYRKRRHILETYAVIKGIL
jgi:RinA family phage transcriptional activator